MSTDLERMLSGAAASPRGELDLGDLEHRRRRRRAARWTAVTLLLVATSVVAASLVPLSREPAVLLDTGAASPSAWPLQVRGEQYSYADDGSYRVRVWEMAGSAWDAVTIVQVAARDVPASGAEGPLARRGEALEQHAGRIAAGQVLVRDPHEAFATVRDAVAGGWLWRREDAALPSPPEQLLGWVEGGLLGHEGELELVADPDRDLLEEVAGTFGIDEDELLGLRSGAGGAAEPAVRGVRHRPSGLPLLVVEIREGRSRPVIEVTDLDLQAVEIRR